MYRDITDARMVTATTMQATRESGTPVISCSPCGLVFGNSQMNDPLMCASELMMLLYDETQNGMRKNRITANGLPVM